MAYALRTYVSACMHNVQLDCGRHDEYDMNAI